MKMHYFCALFACIAAVGWVSAVVNSNPIYATGHALWFVLWVKWAEEARKEAAEAHT
jgi:hypothetical protein